MKHNYPSIAKFQQLVEFKDYRPDDSPHTHPPATSGGYQNPNGILAQSPGLARSDYPGRPGVFVLNPNGVAPFVRQTAWLRNPVEVAPFSVNMFTVLGPMAEDWCRDS